MRRRVCGFTRRPRALLQGRRTGAPRVAHASSSLRPSDRVTAVEDASVTVENQREVSAPVWNAGMKSAGIGLTQAADVVGAHGVASRVRGRSKRVADACVHRRVHGGSVATLSALVCVCEICNERQTGTCRLHNAAPATRGRLVSWGWVRVTGRACVSPRVRVAPLPRVASCRHHCY